MRLFRSIALAVLAVVTTLSSDVVCARAAAATVIDSGEDPSAWTALASPSASARIVSGAGNGAGSAIGLAFDLGRGRSHAILRRALSLDLPRDYMLTFVLKADCEPNTLEIKLISGENVWWRRIPDYEFPRDWKDLRVSTPRISFAWGPAGGGMPTHLDAIEIAVVAGNGGTGKGGAGILWIDEIRLEPRSGEAANRPPTAATTSNAADAPLLVDGNYATLWTSEPGETDAAVTLDFHEPIEQGGLEIDHDADGYSAAYVVEASLDGSSWEEIRRFTHSDGAADYVYTPDVFARYLRLRFTPPATERVAIREIRAQPFEFSSSPNAFFTSIARRAAPGRYPRYFQGEQSYWTVVGVDGDAKEALVNEEGMVEVDAGAFSLEPFVLRGGDLRTWKDGQNSVSLEDGDLPIPTVVRRDGSLSLAVTAFAAGKPGASTLYVRYRLVESGSDAHVRLLVALRPFQVLPPWQALNRTGGVATLREIARDGDAVRADDRRVYPLIKPDGFGAAAFEQGDITAYLAVGALPPAKSVVDSFGHASAAFSWELDLATGKPRDVWIAVPFHAASPVVGLAPSMRGYVTEREPGESQHTPEEVERKYAESTLGALFARTRAAWKTELDRVPIEVPAAARDILSSLRSNLAYILVNRDGPAIQPGSRTYERSWIRDGAMTSQALLELGYADDVKEFLRWYAGYVGEDGWVPCCVDSRGADAVPEHDSFGEFIWAVAETWRFTRDDAFVREMWPRVQAAAACMSRLRAKRMTPEYREGERQAMFGLLPESISHEGYSARPVHSYWDQTFALRGFEDAAMLAGIAGERASADQLAAEAKSFESALRDSIAATMSAHRLDVVPASVELADFDPSSTSAAFLLGLERIYPHDALVRSFDKYAAELAGRRGAAAPGVGYTGYELRNVTSLLLLGRPEDALRLVEDMTKDERPPAWHQWPEISWLVPTEPSFLGDLPHSWIGSTYVHAIRTLLVTEREAEGGGSLLVAAGVPLRWLDGGGELVAHALPTWFGGLSLRIASETAAASGAKTGSASAAHASPVRVRIALESARAVAARAGDASRRAEDEVRAFTPPAGGIVVAAPFGVDVESATVNGVAAKVETGTIRVRRLPAIVIFQYKPRL